MNNVFKKITKLLCYLIISLFIMGIGGEVATAETITVTTDKSGGVQKAKVVDGSNSVVVNADGLMDFRNGIVKGGNRYYKFITDGTDVYCLDAALDAPEGAKTSGSSYVYISDLSSLKYKTENNKTVNLSDIQYKKIAAIIAKSNESSSSISNKYLRYYLTQAAIWQVINGQPSNPGNGSPYTVNFKSWIENNYGTFFKSLLDAASDVKDKVYSVDVTDTANNVLTDNGNDFMESGTLKITSQNVSSDTYTVSIDSDSTTGSCINYGGSCNSTATIPANGEFTVKAPIDSNADTSSYTININVEPTTMPKENTLAVYARVNYESSLDFQKMGKVVTKEIPVSTKKNFRGEYETTKVTNVSIQKVDSDTNERVAGATIELYNSNDSKLGTYISTAGSDANPTVTLPEGNYYLVEKTAPNGYILNSNRFNFSVEKNGTDFVVKQDGNDVATVTLKDMPNKVRFRKVDANGNPVAGVKFIIEDVSLSGLQSGRYYFCGVTGRDGYLTEYEYNGVSCAGSLFNVNTISNNTGIFVLGVDFGSSNGIYRVIEIESANGDDVEIFNNGSLYTAGTSMSYYENKTATYGFSLTQNKPIIYNKYITMDVTEVTGKAPILDFKLTNPAYIDITKSAMGGSEIAGANMILYDTTVTTPDVFGNIDNVVDSWLSTTSEHRITGIIPGRVYELQETLAPEGYIKITTSIFFSMDENGKVTVYSDKNKTSVLNRPDVTTGTNEMTVLNNYTKVQIGKSDMTSGEELEGAEVKICKIDSYNTLGNDCIPEKDEWSWTSGTDGKDENGNINPHEIDALAPGEYCIVETIAPEGYTTNNSYIKQTNSACFVVKEETGIQKIDFLNEPKRVTVNKLDYDTKEPISGVTFQIINVETDEVVREWTTGDEIGHTESALPNGKYKLVETVYPENYNEGMIIDKIVMNEYEFEIDDENYNIEITVYNQKLVGVPNTGISTLNLVAIGGLMVFVGYETIKIYRRKING